MHEVDSAGFGIFFCHSDEIVCGICPERPRAEGQTVRRRRDFTEETVEMLFVADDARQTEETPRRIVGVYRHGDPALLAHRGDLTEEVYHVTEECLFVDRRIAVEQSREFFFRITLVPTGKRKRTLFRVHAVNRLLIVCERGRPVRIAVMQFRAHPVEDGHEVVADDLHTGCAEIADGLLVIFDQRVSFRRAEFDLFVHRHAFDHFHGEPRAVDLLPLCENVFRLPHLADRHMVEGGDDTAHLGDLSDVFECYGVVVHVPAKCHFHSDLSFNYRFL